MFAGMRRQTSDSAGSGCYNHAGGGGTMTGAGKMLVVLGIALILIGLAVWASVGSASAAFPATFATSRRTSGSTFPSSPALWALSC